MDKISIIVPYRNRDITRINRFLESLSKQSNKTFELIFVDAGSELDVAHEVEKIVKSYTFATYIYHDSRGKEWNRSLGMNIGSLYATGNYLYFTDIDLIFHPEYIEHLYQNLSVKNQVYTRVYMVEEKYLTYDRIFESDRNSIAEISHTSGKGILLVSKEVFEEIGGYDEYYSDWGVEDNDIYIRLTTYGLIEKWADYEKYPVFHQWHSTNDSFQFYPEKWMDDISFHYITYQDNYKRNKQPGKLVETKNRKILTVVNNEIDVERIEVPSFGLIATKTLYYRKIWDALRDPEIDFFTVIVPKYKVPKMSVIQSIVGKLTGNVLKMIKSPFSLEYFQKKERHTYFLPEQDIKWYFRKLIKETETVDDYYITENNDFTTYYIQTKFPK